MKGHPKKIFALVTIIVAGVWLFWPGFAPDLSGPPKLHLGVSESFGTDTGAGNVIGIEPFMEPLDYATPARFQAKLDGYLKAAADKGWVGENTIVLLPEHIGTWLIATNQQSRVYSASTTDAAMRPIIMGNLPQFLKNLFIFDGTDKITAAVIRTRTRVSADAQYRVYSALARKYGVTLIAGSSALMTPGVYPDGLSYGHGPIFNAAFVIGPDGQPREDAVRKVHPIPSEVGYIKASKANYLPHFETKDRQIGVLICADSWFADTTRFLADQGIDLLLVPSFLEGASWTDPWQGYVGDEPADDTWRDDVGKITEGEAWQKYALPAKAKAFGIRWGMTVFLKGNLWGHKGSGRALILENGVPHIGKGGNDGATLYNLWLH